MKGYLSKSLSKNQKVILRCLKKLGMYYIPFSIDGNWDFADSIKAITIYDLVEALKKNNRWKIKINVCYVEYPVYMLDIYILDDVIKQEILQPFRKYENHYLNTEIKSNITLYLRYSDILMIYRTGIYKNSIWNVIFKVK